jgi:hypothetical protein
MVQRGDIKPRKKSPQSIYEWFQLTLPLVEAWQGCLDACRLVQEPNETPARVMDCMFSEATNQNVNACLLGSDSELLHSNRATGTMSQGFNVGALGSK